MKRALCAVVFGVFWAGCGGGEPPAEPSLDALEAALSDPVRSLHVPFEVEAAGAMEARVTGDLFLGPEGAARLEAHGTFAGAPLDVWAVSDGERLLWSGAPEPVPAPAGLRDALAVGLTRMGILHNVARLSAGAPPDHMEGGVREWVVVSPDTAGTAPPAQGPEPGLTRTIAVGGTPSGAFRLTFGPEGIRPRVRRQAVAFPQGRMEVTER
ncbi:MAG: hypothetical protein P8188_13785, partial [Gemmatimonadota bacterium]